MLRYTNYNLLSVVTTNFYANIIFCSEDDYYSYTLQKYYQFVYEKYFLLSFWHSKEIVLFLSRLISIEHNHYLFQYRSCFSGQLHFKNNKYFKDTKSKEWARSKEVIQNKEGFSWYILEKKNYLNADQQKVSISM